MKKVHFIGVSGIGMSAVAEISLCRGMEITGSALEENELTRKLQQRGMCFHIGHNASYVHDPDLVVMSAAVPDDNPEVLKARQLAIPVLLYSEYLGVLMKSMSGVAVAGTHGKTTTTAMLAAIVHKAGLDPTVVCGGVMGQFASNAVCGKGDLFIAEACEYHRSFHDLPKRYAIVTNIEEEHLDYYESLGDIREAFTDFLKATDTGGFACVNGDDANVAAALKAAAAEVSRKGGTSQRVVTVGYGDSNAYRTEAKRLENGRYGLGLYRDGAKLFSTELPVPGRFNCINGALAAVTALNLGIEADVVGEALESFKGTARRLELVGVVRGVPVYSDYAHHPTEIENTLLTLHEKYAPRPVTLVFQPHQYSRTAHFFGEFVRVLCGADRLILAEVYRQRDYADAHLSMNSGLLYAQLESKMKGRIVLVEKRGEILDQVRNNLHEKQVLVFMGAGDIDDLAREFITKESP
jgi:UDP-N-acetylmuramate--alanine ligase